MDLTLDQAQRLVAAALEHGRAIGSPPLTVVVLDRGGHAITLARQDGSGIARADIATGKAWIALGLGFGSRELVRRYELMPGFVTALGPATGGRAVPVPGGVLIRDAAGTLLGSVGISGDTSDRDEECAVHGVEQIGLVAQPGADA